MYDCRDKKRTWIKIGRKGRNKSEGIKICKKSGCYIAHVMAMIKKRKINHNYDLCIYVVYHTTQSHASLYSNKV